MSAIKLWIVRCDLCGYVDESISDERAAAARRIARAEGWTRPRPHLGTQMRIDACPVCTKTRAVAS